MIYLKGDRWSPNMQQTISHICSNSPPPLRAFLYSPRKFSSLPELNDETNQNYKPPLKIFHTVTRDLIGFCATILGVFKHVFINLARYELAKIHFTE